MLTFISNYFCKFYVILFWLRWCIKVWFSFCWKSFFIFYKNIEILLEITQKNLVQAYLVRLRVSFIFINIHSQHRSSLIYILENGYQINTRFYSWHNFKCFSKEINHFKSWNLIWFIGIFNFFYFNFIIKLKFFFESWVAVDW